MDSKKIDIVDSITVSRDIEKDTLNSMTVETITEDTISVDTTLG